MRTIYSNPINNSTVLIQPKSQKFSSLLTTVLSYLRFYVLLCPIFNNEDSISISANAEDISGGGFVDYDTNTSINTILQNLNMNSTNPPPKMSLDISQND